MFCSDNNFYGFEHIKANTNMYRNTMYISTITSWLHSQWHRNIATKNRLAFLSLTLIKHFSSRYRTSNKNNTEYRTSVQKITLLHQNKENSEKKQTQKQFFTVTVCNGCQCSRHLLKPKFQNNKFNLILDIFSLQKLMLPKLQTLHCNGILISNNHSNCSLTKV